MLNFFNVLSCVNYENYFQSFKPGVILVSAGFDAAEGHPPTIGGYNVSPACFASMTSSLLPLADGKVMLTNN